MNPFSVFTAEAIGYLSSLFVFVIGVGALLVVVLFVRDVTQTKDAIRRNFPVIGRFRYFFSKLGEFFRQYFFAQDREELRRSARQLRSPRSDQDILLGQTHHAGGGRLGVLRWRRQCQFGPRIHVRPRLHIIAKMQQEHLPNGHHHPRPTPAARSEPHGQIGAGEELRRQDAKGSQHHCSLVRRGASARAEALPLPHRAGQWPIDSFGRALSACGAAGND
jgi:hypothetical protein